MIKITCSITARPSFSRIETVLENLKDNPKVDLTILLSCSALAPEYGAISEIIKSKGYHVAEISTLSFGDDYQDICDTAGETLKKVAAYLTMNRPDFVISVADRYETLAVASAAAFHNINLIHIQGGEISGNIDEKVRHAVTKLSDYHFVATEKARSRLISMGEQPDTVFNFGCPSLDLVASKPSLTKDELIGYINSVGNGSTISASHDYIVILAHPETESYGQNTSHFENLFDTINELDTQIVYFWPNLDVESKRVSKIIRTFREFNQKPKTIRFIKNLPSEIFLNLIEHASCMVGNSSAGLREAGFMGIPVVNIGDRQRGRDRSQNVIDTDWDSANIKKAVIRNWGNSFPKSKIYGDGNSGSRIANQILQLSKKTEKIFYE